MCLRTWTVEVTDDCGHTGLVAHGGGEVNRLLGVILREAVDFLVLALNWGPGSTHDLTFPR